MKLVGERTITSEQIQEVVKKVASKEISKGAGIRELFAGGLEVKEISTLTGIRYNHVYNVVKNEVLVNDLEVETSSRNNENSKKNQILGLLAEGKSITEVSKEMKCMYNYVWQIAKGAGYTNKQKVEEISTSGTADTLIQEIVESVTKNQQEAKKKGVRTA